MMIGCLNSPVKYYNTDDLKVKNGGVLVWQGIRSLEKNKCLNMLDGSKDNFVICGTTQPNIATGIGAIYVGEINCKHGLINYLVVPNSISTSVYGPNYNKKSKLFNFVGSFINENQQTKGFVYVGNLKKPQKTLKNPANFIYPSVNNIYNTVFVHSIMGHMYLGNSGNSDENLTYSFLYDIRNNNEYTEIKFPDSATTTSYGIWRNENGTYTIVGGFSMDLFLNINQIYQNGLPIPYGQSFLVIYDPESKTFSDWMRIILPFTTESISHIEGIYGDGCGNYSLSIDVRGIDVDGGYYGVAVPEGIQRYRLEKFVRLDSEDKVTANSVAKNCVVGLNPEKSTAFQAKIIC